MYKYIIILICIIFILHYLQNFIEIFTGKYPDIKIIENLISEKECDILIKLAKPTLKTSRVFNPDTQKSVLHSERNSKNTFLPYNNLTDKIYKKLENITNISLYNYEVLQITNYIKGQYYRPHYDNIEKYNIRTKTLIIYLSDDYTGGYTSFPLLQKKFKLKKGSAILFDNLDKNNNTHYLSLHQGLPVYNGSKWIAQVWINLPNNDFV
tara:strand:- start:1322 stop:1948 length:627 start_codon:yes stop_codon:yes gene_type:complete